jgi:hypothetical protein
MLEITAVEGSFGNPRPVIHNFSMMGECCYYLVGMDTKQMTPAVVSPAAGTDVTGGTCMYSTQICALNFIYSSCSRSVNLAGKCVFHCY